MFRFQQIIIRGYVCTSLKLLNYLKKNTEFKILKIIPGVVAAKCGDPCGAVRRAHVGVYLHKPRGVFRLRQSRQLPRAVDLKGRLSKLSKLLIATTPFHSLTERYSMNVDGNFN